MIDEKKIEEAAEKQLETIQPYSIEERLDRKEPISLYEKNDVLAMFKTGINWFKENLWHDASEEPNKDLMFTYILCETDKGYDVCDGYLVKLLPIGESWESFVSHNYISRWLYIEDLMKGGK